MVPEIAQRKLSALTQQTEDARALAFSAKDRASVLATKVTQLGNARASEADIAKAADQAERALDLQMQRYRAWQEREQLMTRLKAWLTEQRNVTLEAVPVPSVTMNGSPVVTVGTLRAEIGKLAVLLHSILVAPAPLDDAKAQVRRLVATLAKKGAPHLTTQGGTLLIHHWSPTEQFGPPTFAHITEFLAWYDPERMIAQLDEAVEALPASAHALPLDLRARRLVEIEAEIYDLEVQEECIIERAAKDGIVIERRFDQSPASILGVKIASAAARVAA